MKHLIIYAHPNAASLNQLFKQTIEETLRRQKYEVVVRDLYQLNFDPVLSLEDMDGQRSGRVSEAIRREQEHIVWADAVTFIYPIWWTGMPAIMKGYIDRVFSYGFAYRYDNGIQKGLLAGKSAFIINSHGKSKIEYQEIGMDNALKLTSDKLLMPMLCGNLLGSSRTDLDRICYLFYGGCNNHNPTCIVFFAD